MIYHMHLKVSDLCVFSYAPQQYRDGIGVGANIHLGGGQTEFCPNRFGGGGVIVDIFRDPYSVGGGSSRHFPRPIRWGGGLWQNFVRLLQ